VKKSDNFALVLPRTEASWRGFTEGGDRERGKANDTGDGAGDRRLVADSCAHRLAVDSGHRPGNWATDATPVSPYAMVSPFAEAPHPPGIARASSPAADLSYAAPWLDEVCELTASPTLDPAVSPQRLATQGAIAARVTEAQDAEDLGADVGTFTARVDEARALMSKKPPDRERAVAILRGLARSMQAIRHESAAGPEVLESSDGRLSGSLMMSKGLAEVEIQVAKIRAGAQPQWERLRNTVAAATESYGLAAGQRDPKTSQLGRADGTMQTARYGQLALASLPLLPAIPQMLSSAWTWALTNPITAVGVGELGVDVGLGMGQAGGVGNWMRGMAEEPAAILPYLMPFVPGWMFGKRGQGTTGRPRAPGNRDMTQAEWRAAQSTRRRLAREQQRIGVEAPGPIDVSVGPEPTTPAPGSRVRTGGTGGWGDR
jgi:hypothetical protein